jgi:hypothetical protein
MSAHEPGDFPPHWDPPPRLAYRHARPDIGLVQDCVNQMELKPWVREIFTEKTINSMREWTSWGRLSPEEVERRLTFLEQSAIDPESLEDMALGLALLEDRPDLPETTREAVRRCLEKIDPQRPTRDE